MIPLFGESEADGRRDVLEGRLIWVALEALRVGTSVVLDFGQPRAHMLAGSVGRGILGSNSPRRQFCERHLLQPSLDGARLPGAGVLVPLELIHVLQCI
ncbi:hypothetical protein [Krasilnikovia sp. M28-CT-15]|uniref:hypothetical protein n=1 Tax=Krasilnikovia sp. M28-CT-15 TaxID=3373540 RepID=UPI003876A50A